MVKKNSKQESVKVMVRARPMNQKELQRKCKSVIQLNKENREINFKQDYHSVCSKTFVYDNVFDNKDTQQQVYEQSAFSIVESVLDGYNGTIFAYGQTGCGKTYSMLGDINNNDQKGIIPRACSHIINKLALTEADLIQCIITCSFIEIYNEQIYDLLSDEKFKRDIKMHPKNGIFVKDLIKIEVNSIQDIIKQLQSGEKNRSVGSTAMNATSSRSHCIFTIQITTTQQRQKLETVKSSKLNLVDLAGSERQSKTQAKDQRLKEANAINLSLSTLGNVISALVSRKKVHIPYRDSKLTRLLQDSLGGNTKTLMMAAISPADYNIDETVSTLKYAARTSLIKNDPKINEDPRDALIKQFEQELLILKNQLQKTTKSKPKSLTIQQQSNDQNQQEQSQDTLKEEINKRQDLETQIQELKKQFDNLDKKKFNQRKSLIGNQQEIQYLQQVQEKLVKEEEKFIKKQEEIMNKNFNQKEELRLLQQELQQIIQDNEQATHNINEEIQEYTYNLKEQQDELLILKQIANQIFSKKELQILQDKTIFDVENEENFQVPQFIFEEIGEDQQLPNLHQKIQYNKIKKHQRNQNSVVLQPINKNMNIYTPKKNHHKKIMLINKDKSPLQFNSLNKNKLEIDSQYKNKQNIGRIKLQPLKQFK